MAWLVKLSKVSLFLRKAKKKERVFVRTPTKPEEEEKSPTDKREYLVNILIMPEWHFHFLSVVAARLQDHPVACPQLRKESESAARALLK